MRLLGSLDLELNCAVCADPGLSANVYYTTVLIEINVKNYRFITTCKAHK